jgi:hypothetical protein
MLCSVLPTYEPGAHRSVSLGMSLSHESIWLALKSNIGMCRCRLHGPAPSPLGWIPWWPRVMVAMMSRGGLTRRIMWGATRRFHMATIGHKFRHIYLATHASMRDRDLKLALPERRRYVVPFVVDCSDLNVPAERSNARVQKECDKSCNQRHRRRRRRRPPFGGTHVHVGTPAI